MRPMVVVVENPNEDPTVLAIGNVEVIELSTYPISRYADASDLLDTGYEEELRELLTRISEAYRPAERSEVETQLVWMLEETARYRRKYGEDPDGDLEDDLEDETDGEDD